MFRFILIIFISSCFYGNSQIIKKENLSKKVSFFYDINKLKIESTGFYYVDKVNKNSTIKHGKWIYYSKNGEIEQEVNYYKDLLHGKVAYFYPGSKPKSEGYFKLGKQDSVYREWNEFGKLVLEAYFSKDKPVGIWKTYYYDGRLKSIEEYKDTVAYLNEFYFPDSLHTAGVINGNGEMATFFNTGSVKEYYIYKNGLKDGVFEERTIYGFVAVTGKFKAGLKDSTWSYRYTTGEIEKVSNYKDGLLNGSYKYYYDKNRINVEGQYENGKKTGKWTWYTNKGTRDMEGEFLDDKQHGDWTYWYATGEISYYAHFNKDKKAGQWTYLYKNGSKFKEGTFENDEKNGTWKTWYESGALLMEGKFVNGKEEGEWINKWENGQIKDQSTFKNGQLNGDWISMNPDGKVKSKGTYKNNMKTGEWLVYFDNGKIKDITTYKIIKKKSKIKYGILKDYKTEESMMHGLYVAYSSKDYKMTEKGNYKEGKKDGQWTDYHPGGKFPAVVTNYKNGELNGWMEQYDRKGNIISKSSYKNGVKDGKFYLYNEKGKVIVEKNYENGMEINNDPRYQGGYFTPGK